jgi:hypothetical protein
MREKYDILVVDRAVLDASGTPELTLNDPKSRSLMMRRLRADSAE